VEELKMELKDIMEPNSLKGLVVHFAPGYIRKSD
jgi:hypothetical protein